MFVSGLPLGHTKDEEDAIPIYARGYNTLMKMKNDPQTSKENMEYVEENLKNYAQTFELRKIDMFDIQRNMNQFNREAPSDDENKDGSATLEANERALDESVDEDEDDYDAAYQDLDDDQADEPSTQEPEENPQAELRDDKTQRGHRASGIPLFRLKHLSVSWSDYPSLCDTLGMEI